MKVVIAPDKLRGSLSAAEAAHAIARGIFRVDASATVVEVPMADGGEGTVEALTSVMRGESREVTVSGPLGLPVTAKFGLIADGRAAVMEMASASGLSLVPRDGRDPERASTRGTGELLLAAIDAGATKMILGIGGSATNDGGAGFAQALGYHLLDADGREIMPGGGDLGRLQRIDRDGVDPRLAQITLSVACDVDNPLCGCRGASVIFGPQKGASPAVISRLDANLAHFAEVVKRDLGRDVAEQPGAGAAGGLGLGTMVFANATLEPGVLLVARIVGLERHFDGADLVLTGEGAIDGSSAGGKTAVGVARLARSRGIPVIALAGAIGPGAESVLAEGVDAYASLCNRPMSLDAALGDAARLLASAAEQAFRIFLLGRRNRP